MGIPQVHEFWIRTTDNGEEFEVSGLVGEVHRAPLVSDAVTKEVVEESISAGLFKDEVEKTSIPHRNGMVCST